MYGCTLSSTSALDGRGQCYGPAVLPQESPGSHCIRGWVGLRDGLDACKNLTPP